MAKSVKMERVPLSGTFMIISIIGLIICVQYTFSGTMNQIFLFMGPYVGYSFGTAFILVFLLMFIASVVSITPSFDELKELK